MATNHQVSVNTHDRYHGVVKAKDLHSQKLHGHGNNMRVWEGKEGSKHGPETYGNADRGHGNPGCHDGRRDPVGKNGESQPWQGKTSFHGRDNIDYNGNNRNYDRYDFADRDLSRRDEKGFSHGGHRFPNKHDACHSILHGVEIKPVRITHAAIFKRIHLGGFAISRHAHDDFLKLAIGFLKKPDEKSYKALNDNIMKLMDSRFTPAISGGAAKISIRDVRGMTMVRFTMKVTPAPVKTLDEAREALKNAYSTKRDGEKGIADIRAEAYTDYIRALSEKYKQNGTIKHTNHTPTTPVFQSSVIYVIKITQINAPRFHEIKKPQFGNHFHGRLHFKNQHGFWNHQRPRINSHVDLLKNHSKVSHMDHDYKARKAIEAKHGGCYSRHDRVDKPNHKGHARHNHQAGSKAGKAS